MAGPARDPAAALAAADALLAPRPAPGGEGAWAVEARAAACARLRAMGAPGRRDEYWRFTDPAPLTDPAAAPAALLAADEAPVFGEIDALRLVFVDGAFRPDLSDAPEMAGVEIAPLSEAMAADIHWAREVYGALETAGQDPVARPLAALNTATAREGFAIRVTGKAPRPVNFSYLRATETGAAMIHHVLRLDPGAEMTLLENGPGAARLNVCVEIDIADGARFHHVRTQGRDHERLAATHMFARLGAASAYKSFTLTANGRLTRNEQVVELLGDDAMAHVAGACMGEDDFHHDDTVFITHDALNCESRQVYKKVLRKGARGVFQGKILVKAGAQKTDGYQISQGLLLDDGAEFDAKPELEIYADDVVCSHGSTCGAVDETAMFYLRSRGVSEIQAQNMLVLAFLDQAVAEIEDAALAGDVRARIAGWLARHTG